MATATAKFSHMTFLHAADPPPQQGKPQTRTVAAAAAFLTKHRPIATQQQQPLRLKLAAALTVTDAAMDAEEMLT